jgi:hypothetical protein
MLNCVEHRLRDLRRGMQADGGMAALIARCRRDKARRINACFALSPRFSSSGHQLPRLEYGRRSQVVPDLISLGLRDLHG